MIKKFFFLFLSLFFTCSIFAQKTYIQCGRLIDGVSNTEQKVVNKVKHMKNETFVIKEGKVYNQ